MKLVQLKCPGCGAKLEVNPDLEQYTCNYCGISTVLDDEAIKVKNISSKLDTMINDLKEYYDNGNYEKCYRLSICYLREYPKNEQIASLLKKSKYEYAKDYSKVVLSYNYKLSADSLDSYRKGNNTDSNAIRYLRDFEFMKEMSNEYPDEKCFELALVRLEHFEKKYNGKQTFYKVLIIVLFIIFAFYLIYSNFM